jgi:hypothetical protein
MYSNKKLVTENRDNAIDLLKKNDRKNWITIMTKEDKNKKENEKKAT